MMKFGLLGSGSWGTALAKLLTDNQHPINWWLRSDENIVSFKNRHHNPQYLRSAIFDTALINFSSDPEQTILESDIILISVPSAFVVNALKGLNPNIFNGKRILSAIKGILPGENVLLHTYLQDHFSFSLNDYFTVLGPCHAEEVAEEKLSYLTFSGLNLENTMAVARHFATSYLKTLHNQDVLGTQYAAVLKNIYAIGAGIAHGLEYGDNFLSVLIANSADEMVGFLKKSGRHIEVGKSDSATNRGVNKDGTTNYAASVYLGDLLVTCYSLFSRNRTFGNMIGKGYSVKAAQLEMNMVAEGYHASKGIFIINQKVKAEMPIAETIYNILWNGDKPNTAFEKIESILI